MIFVTVGNPHNQSMRTLLAVEELAARGAFGEEPIIVQSGNNPEFKPQYCRSIPFMDMETFGRHIREARVVICHAGAGSLSHVIRTGKTPVVVPRRLKYGEHIDDHQMELLEAFAARGLLIPAVEVSDLPRAIEEAAARPQLKVSLGDEGRRLVSEAIDSFLEGSAGD